VCFLRSGFSGDEDAERGKGGEEVGEFALDLEAAAAEGVGVLAGELVVGEDGDAAGLKDAGDLGAGVATGGLVIDVMEAEVGQDDVEAVVGEAHGLHSFAEEGAAISDAFEGQISLGSVKRVAAEVFAVPDVDTGGVAGRDAAGGADEKKAAAGADVEDLLVATPGMEVQHAVAVVELSDERVEEHERATKGDRDADAEGGGPKLNRGRAEMEDGRKNEAEDDGGGAGEEEVTDDAGGIDTVVGACGQSVLLRKV
jgi:hypothetical protein